MKIKLLFFALLSSTLMLSQNKGVVTGIITDQSKNNEPISFADVSLKGSKTETKTEIDGKFSISAEPGTYIIVFSTVGYLTVEKTVVIKENETTIINQGLTSESNNLKEVVVKATGGREKETAILMDQKKSVEMKQSIGSQEMSRKGVSNVESGLTKITGITKVDGRGLFVRGLEDRYNNLLINGLAVPSNNPFKKIIPLDLFPTDIVGVIETYKTFNSNVYGDFAGATFNILTARGGKSLTKINFGTGFTTGNNLNKFIISNDANTTNDFFGFSGNERNIPTALGNVPSYYTLTATEASQFGSGYDVTETKSPLNTSFGVLNAENFNIGKNNHSINYLFSLNFENKYQVRQGIDRFFNGGGIYENNLENNSYKFSTNTSLLLALNYKSKRLNLTSNTFYLKTTENMIQDQIGSTNGTTINNKAFIRLNQLLETSFLNTQLAGIYKITEDDKHNLKAAISYTKTAYSLPDRKSFKGVKLDDNTSLINFTGNSLYRQYFDIDGKFHLSGMMEYNYKFGKDEGSKSNKLTVGFNGYATKMESIIRFLISNGSQPVSVITNNPDSVFASNIQSGNLTYSEGTNSTYKARLEEVNNAGYIDLALKIGENIDLNIGGRLENSIRRTRYRNSGSFDDKYVILNRVKTDFFPSLNTKYKINEISNLRFTTSKTITKPVIMEVYPAEFVNLDGTIENGNPEIINSNNYNFDFKYELFPSNNELFAVTAFSKYLQNPIERIFTQSAGSGGQIITYDNSKKAVIYGAEFEFLLKLEKFSKHLSNLSLGFNTSLMYTKVTIDKIENATETIATDADPTRNLQGASPWLINADLKYEFNFSETWKNTMTLVYSVYGKRIYAVGTNLLDNYYENPFHKLDLVWGSKVNKNWDLKFAIDNILNPNYNIVLGNESKLIISEKDLTVKAYKKGVGFSFNVSYSF